MKILRILPLMLLPACVSEQRLAEKCRQKFPCSDLFKGDTSTFVTFDTIWSKPSIAELPCSSISCIESHLDGSIIVAQSAPMPHIKETVTKVITRWYEDSAKLYLKEASLQKVVDVNHALSSQVDDLENEVKDLNLKRHNLWKFTFFLLGVIAIALLLNLFLIKLKKQ